MPGKLIGFGVRNLRSFSSQEQLVPIKSINVLVGKNSCGKSTFLRTYPLLRQSIEADTRSPILWYAGYGGYVDFGDFKTSVHDGRDSISFDFLLQLEVENKDFEIDYFTHKIQNLKSVELTDLMAVEGKAVSQHSVKVELGLSMQDKDKLLNKLIFSVDGVQVELEYSELLVNRFEVVALNSGYRREFHVDMVGEKGDLIPTAVWTLKDMKHENRNIKTIDRDYMSRSVVSNIYDLLGIATSRSKKIREKIKGLVFSSNDELRPKLISLLPESSSVRLELESGSNVILEAVRANLLAQIIHHFWKSADESFKIFYGGVRYMGPIRASAERFYRFQDLQVGELDHTGANLPMLINSLDRPRRRELAEWMRLNFGFSLDLQVVGSHYALKIKEDGEEEFHNISDMGFGYSQILPVIVSVWLELVNNNAFSRGGVFRNKKPKSRTLVIEQPELHLHPALQYKFGLAIAKVAALGKEQGYNFVIETHSKHFIDALGESVRKEYVSADDVSIGLFDKDKSGQTQVRFSRFDSDGYLVDWPVGFLSA